ncbi:hypothetical protein RJT34_17155 [Clitoria ternatea]|uniref:Uncharacterized protein n=1 Tax=Clitoria ternatea TaxID=43366 RepID=A0AAN9JAK4_CLITE
MSSSPRLRLVFPSASSCVLLIFMSSSCRLLLSLPSFSTGDQSPNQTLSPRPQRSSRAVSRSDQEAAEHVPLNNMLVVPFNTLI